MACRPPASAGWRPRARALYPVGVVGYMSNDVLPWRLGAVVRAYALPERAGVSTGATLATIAVERVFDGLTMLGFLLVASLFIGFTDPLRRLALVATLIFGALLLALSVAVHSGDLRARALRLAERLLPAAL